MSIKEKMLKDKNVLFGEDTTEPTRDGELSITTQEREDKPRDSIKLGASGSIDHSISDLDYQ
jgi:hypothetical protein